jgi:hypothetical protein
VLEEATVFSPQAAIGQQKIERKIHQDKTENGKMNGEILFLCKVMDVMRQGFYQYLESLEKSWKYETLAAKMYEIIAEDECNDTYGSMRMHQALLYK